MAAGANGLAASTSLVHLAGPVRAAASMLLAACAEQQAGGVRASSGGAVAGEATWGRSSNSCGDVRVHFVGSSSGAVHDDAQRHRKPCLDGGGAGRAGGVAQDRVGAPPARRWPQRRHRAGQRRSRCCRSTRSRRWAGRRSRAARTPRRPRRGRLVPTELPGREQAIAHLLGGAPRRAMRACAGPHRPPPGSPRRARPSRRPAGAWGDHDDRRPASGSALRVRAASPTGWSGKDG